MKDCFGRDIDYLRISVTDRCNLRCVYCMPEEGVQALGHDQILTYEEILEVARVAKGLGIEHVRITGGEPLVRKNLVSLVKGLNALGFPDISMTTNGILLPPLSRGLKEAGLNRVNISLDTLDPDKFSRITRRGKLEDALRGIKSALEAGLNPVKINTVVTGENFREIQDIAALTFKWPVHVRFIEFMPIGPDPLLACTATVPIQAVVDEMAQFGHLLPFNKCGPSGSAFRSAGPAETFKFPNAPGTVGFIGAMSHPFCSACNRLRLTADGKLRPCLADDVEIDLVAILRQATTKQTARCPETKALKRYQAGDAITGSLEDAFRLALSLKPQRHNLTENHAHSRRMCQIGG